MNKIREMLVSAEAAGKLTLNDIRRMIQRTTVDTDLATMTAAEMENAFLDGANRNEKIAAFLSGLLANLID